MKRFQIHIIFSLLSLLGIWGDATYLHKNPAPNQVHREIASESEDLQQLLNIDRFLYYVSEYISHREKKLPPEVITALSKWNFQTFYQSNIDSEKFSSAENYDQIIANILRKEFPELSLTDEQINWNYNFLKKKLDEAFIIKPIQHEVPESDIRPAPRVSSSYVIPTEDLSDSTLDTSHYISDRTTRAIFWEASINNRPIEFHLGNEREFQNHLEEQKAQVIGEIRTKASNYNKTFLVQYPDSPQAHIAITRVNGHDRLEHLVYSLNLENVAESPLKNVQIYGDLTAFHREESKKLTELMEKLPSADKVIIGQKGAFDRFFSGAAKFHQLQEVMKSPSSAAYKKLSTKEIDFLKNLISKDQPELVRYPKELDDIHDKLASDLPELPQRSQFNLLHNSHDLSDSVFIDSSGKEQRWRFISNVWGDEIIPVANALKETNHKKVVYIGTTGAFPEKGLNVGDVVIPNTVLYDQEKITVNQNALKDIDGAIYDKSVANVASPFVETQQWLEDTSKQADVVEVETKYLAKIFGDADDQLDIYLMVSDVLGSDETLASGSSSKRKRGLQKIIHGVLERNNATKPIMANTSPVPSFEGGVDKKIRELAKSKDPIFLYHLLRKAHHQQISEGQVEEFIDKQKAFTTSFFEKKMEEVENFISPLSLDLLDENGYTQYSIDNRFLTGEWNPKKEKFSIVLSFESDESLENARKVYQEKLSSLKPKFLDLKFERGPPSEGTTFTIPRAIQKDDLIDLYSRSALKNQGLYQTLTRTGKLKYQFLPTTSSTPLCQSEQICGLSFFNPDPETKKILKKLPSFESEDAIQAIEDIIKRFNESSSFGWSQNIADNNIHYEYKIVDSLPNNHLARISPKIDSENGKVIVELQITREGLNNPLVVLEEIIHLAQIRRGSFTNPEQKFESILHWVELAKNAENNGKLSQLALLKYELDAQNRILEITSGSSTSLKPSIVEYLTENDQLVNEFCQSRIAHINAMTSELKAQIKVENKTRKQVFAAAKKFRTTLESNKEKLNDLIGKNDRQGVANLLEQYVPWEQMEPTERASWISWISEIRSPSDDRVVLFRGLGGDYIPRNAEGKPFLMAPVLTRNQGSYTRRLRSLTSQRKKYSYNFDESVPMIHSLFQHHSNDPNGSPFLSLSNLHVADDWDGNTNKIAAISVSKNRVTPNIISDYVSENERLIPMFVFPDEIIHYSEDEPIDHFQMKVEQILGRELTEAEQTGGNDYNVKAIQGWLHTFDDKNFLSSPPASFLDKLPKNCQDALQNFFID